MSVPCKARCKYEDKGVCQLEDNRVRGSQVEFSSELDPGNSCSCFEPKDNKKFNKK